LRLACLSDGAAKPFSSLTADNGVRRLGRGSADSERGAEWGCWMGCYGLLLVGLPVLENLIGGGC